MKRAKMMLTGIAVLTIVGGALAFKAKTYTATGPIYCTTSGACAFADFQTGQVSGETPTNEPCGLNNVYYTIGTCGSGHSITTTSATKAYPTVNLF
jgi:hypothetical protein